MGEIKMINANGPKEGLWTVREAAGRLGTTVHGLYKMVERRQVPHLRVGRRIRFDPAVISAWLTENSVPAGCTAAISNPNGSPEAVKGE